MPAPKSTAFSRHARHQESLDVPLASSSFSNPGTSTLLPITQHHSFQHPGDEVVLRTECAGDRSVRAGVAFAKAVAFIGAFFLLLLTLLKFRKKGDWFLRSTALFIANITIGSFCLAAAFTSAIIFGCRLRLVHTSGKKWAKRRAFFATITYSSLLIQCVYLIFFVWPSVYILVDDCSWFSAGARWAAVVRQQCLGVIFFGFVIQAHAVLPWDNPAAPSADALRIDAPAFYMSFWPHLLLWVLYALLDMATGVILQLDEAGWTAVSELPEGEIRMPAGKCYRGSLACPLSKTAFGLKLAINGVLLLFLLTWLVLIMRGWRLLVKGCQANDRIAALSIRIQVRNKGFPVLFIFVCIILLGYVRPTSCASFVEAWLGSLPTTVVLTIEAMCSALAFMPTNPADGTPPTLQVWLQEFAWTELDQRQKLARRRMQWEHSLQLRTAPMFCFETAIRLFYWSTLMYRHEESVQDQSVTVETAMKLYDLQSFELLWEAAEDTKALMAWSAQRIVLSFRGTASWANVLADLQFWLKEHPPARGRGTSMFGSRPHVHSGFLRSWQASGLNDKVVERVRKVAEDSAACGVKQMTVYVTGHSLGGALATLAAYDIAARFPSLAVSCYTFGAPRTGNRAFADDYSRVVEDTWHIINDQDLVTRGGKLAVFKRPGHRVLLKQGGMLVRPSDVEVSLHHVPFRSSARDHLISKYKQALMAVMLQQMHSSSRSKETLQGMVALVEDIRLMTPSESKRGNTRYRQETELLARVTELVGMSFTAMGMADRATAVSPPLAAGTGSLLLGDPSIFSWEPPEGSSNTEDGAHQAGPAGLHRKGEPPQPSTPPVQQQHPPPQPSDDGNIPMRMYSDLPPVSPQAPQQSGRSLGLSGTFRRLAAGWSLSEARLQRPDGEGGDRTGHAAADRRSGITSSGTFQRLDLLRPLAGTPDGDGDCCEGTRGGGASGNSIPCIAEGLERSVQ